MRTSTKFLLANIFFLLLMKLNLGLEVSILLFYLQITCLVLQIKYAIKGD